MPVCAPLISARRRAARRRTPCFAGGRGSSPLSGMKCWVEASEFDAGILGCELPFDLRSGGIAPLRPAGDLALEGVLMGDAARQALARKDAQLDLRLVQPGAVLGRVVDLEPVR